VIAVDASAIMDIVLDQPEANARVAALEGYPSDLTG
jgi:hypothetical protein